MTEKIGRNEPCPCGSGKKYKQCCLKNNKPGKKRFKATVLSAKTMKAAVGQDSAAEEVGPDLIARLHSGAAVVSAEESVVTEPEILEEK